MRKLVKESLNESIKINNVEYNVIKYNNQTIYIGKEGVLGYKGILVPWNIIKKLLSTF